MSPTIDRHAGTVLVVDDAPDALRMLCMALASEGYTVMVAQDGLQALERLELVVPDAILLDAVMPGFDGFETCRRIKARGAWAHVPVIFMTGLSETTDIVAGFDAGGVDYVVKPLRVDEVLARLGTHLRNARVVRLARDAVDVGGHGVLLLDARLRVAWRSPQAERWLRQAFPDLPAEAPFPFEWMQALVNSPTGHEVRHGLAVQAPAEQVLVARNLGAAGVGETMVLLSVQAATGSGVPAVGADDDETRRSRWPALTPRETEVLTWLSKGKTNRDIAEILGMSPRTVNKHLEHIFQKLGVETRSAAAALASRTLDV